MSTLGDRSSLTRHATVSLDAARAAAAIYVVAHHYALSRNFTGALGVFKHFGHQAVMMFFLLSGFVIYVNERSRLSEGLLGYAFRRIKRIYPCLLCAIAVSAIVMSYNGSFAAAFSWRSLAATLLALQGLTDTSPGGFAYPFLDNNPLWSLSYEIWFYVLFPFALMLKTSLPRLGPAIIGLASCSSYVLYILHPNHLFLVVAYFAIWWLGAMIGDAYLKGGRSVLSVPVPALFLAALCLVSAVPTIGANGPSYGYPFLQLNHFATGLVMAAVLFGPVGAFVSRRTIVASTPAALVSSISYGLYVMHYPILVQWDLSRTAAGLAVALFLLILLCFAGDRWLTGLIGRVARRRYAVPSMQEPYPGERYARR